MRSTRFTAFEHDRLVVGEGGFLLQHFEALANYVERTETPALTIAGRQTIKIGSHVGYLRVGPVSLEIYPKLGKGRPDSAWTRLLFEMLRAVAGIRLAPQEHAPLERRAGDLYELLVARFIEVTEALLREGLARSYRQIEENGTCFRGRLLVGEHVRANLVRRERVFVAYEVHDADNLVNRILRRAVDRVQRTSAALALVHRAQAAIEEFPEVSDRPIRPADWGAIRLDRRTLRYREALDLARMILRDERPDLKWGQHEVISLLFEMNSLFEAYLEAAARGVPGVRVKAQARRRFWEPVGHAARILKPDLLVSVDGHARPVVVDAKWKVPKDGKPADDDLRQIFAYLHGFDAERGLLVYPSQGQAATSGAYLGGGLGAETAFLELFDAAGAPGIGVVREGLKGVLGLLPVVGAMAGQGVTGVQHL